MAKESKKGQKIGVLLLYIVIILGLLAGFLIPMDFNAEDVVSTMLVMQIPDALAKFLAAFAITIEGLSGAIVTGGGTLPELAISSPMSFMSGNVVITLDINAWLVVIYAVITVLAVICIIPAIVGCVTKKDKETKQTEKAVKAAKKQAKKNGEDPEEAAAAVLAEAAAAKAEADPFADDSAAAAGKKKKAKETTFRTAFTLEVLSAIVLFAMNLLTAVNMQFIGASACMPVSVAFMVVVVVGFIQRIIASGGSGVVKFILFILSLAAVLFTFFNVCLLIPALSDPINSLFTEDFPFTAGFFGGEGALDLEYLCNFVFLTEGSLGDLLTGISGAGMAWIIGSFILGIMLLVNCFFDLLGIYKKTTKGMLVMNQIRYIIAVLALLLCVAMVLLATDLEFGLLLIACAVLVLVGWIINIARLVRFNRMARAEALSPDEVEQMLYFAPARKEKPQTVYVSSFMEPAYVAMYPATTYVPSVPRNAVFYPHYISQLEPIHGIPAAPAARTAAHSSAAPAAPAAPASCPCSASGKQDKGSSSGFIYEGPEDKFMSTLTNDEKVEFARVFIVREKDPIPFIPEYKIGVDNSAFFSSVLLHYTFIRDLVSPGLMEKMYEADRPRE